MATVAAWGQAPYAGSVLVAPPVGQLPPPIPGDPARFTYVNQQGAYPWGMASWAGGFPPLTYPGGGVVAHPDAADGVMMVQGWWPNVDAVSLVRISEDGTRIAVRGGYPAAVAGVTRRNACLNPSVEVGLNGYVPGTGTTLTQLADTAAPDGEFVLRCSNASAGSNGVTVPTGLDTTPGTQQMTVGFGMRLSALPTSVTVTVGWADALGGALATSSVALTGDQMSASVSEFARSVVSFTPPTGAVTPTLKITAAGMPAGGTMDLDAITFEIGLTDGSGFDGDSLGATWLGTTGLSASQLAPIVTILDGECPLDELVRYQLQPPGILGGWVVSDPVLLPSNGITWLTHPSSPDTPIQVDLRIKPVRTYPILQGVFAPLGRVRKVVVNGGPRQGGEGTIAVNAASLADRTALMALIQDGASLLLRPPGFYNYDVQWISLATVTDDPEARLAHQDAWLISAPFIEVDPPSVLV